jgi:GWxTD domain-containing protein
MRASRTLAVLLALAASAAAAGLSKYKDWADSPQAYFLSKAEREAWAAVRTDEEAEKFIAGYQAARGKGFAAAIQSRIDVAEKTYRTGKAKGARSPQGRTLVLLGEPTTVERRTAKDKSVSDPSGAAGLAYSDQGGKAGGGAANPLSNVGGPGPNTMRGMQAPEPGFIRWIYRDSKVPPGVGQKELIVTFDDDAAGNVTFQDPAAAEAVFQKVVDYWAPKKK